MNDDKRDIEGSEALPAAVKRRRRFSAVEKRQIVEETLVGDASVSQVARRHDINANQLFRWRKLHREGQLPGTSLPAPATGLLPVVTSSPSAATENAVLDIELGNGRRIVVSGAVDPATLRVVLEMLA